MTYSGNQHCSNWQLCTVYMQLRFGCSGMLRWQLPIQHQHGKNFTMRVASGLCTGAPLPQSGPSITMCLQYALKIDKEKVDKSRGKSVLQQELQVMAGSHSFCKHNQLGGAAST